ncbi:hypothetical protein cand_023450 [Cryptosporidium andersoni]|uniref:Uncharacterized protein n=1 Tax=Cryptosporidium andersoni TaxID=117008 RepID=A0A1J4MRY8_9CRYT|nr:hypothetical protein cand_023450 [Cryptosporidium andersoni]
MKIISSTDISLDDKVFIKFRLSNYIHDSLIWQDCILNKTDFNNEEIIKNLSKILRDSNLIIEPFNFEGSNLFSCSLMLGNEPFQLTFSFGGVILKENDINSDERKFINLICTETIGHDIAANKLKVRRPIGLINSNILGFIDFFGKDNVNYSARYTLRLAYIKVIALTRLYGANIPIYIYEGSNYIIKVQIVTLQNPTVSYELIHIDLLSKFIGKEHYLYTLETWYNHWNQIVDSNVIEYFTKSHSIIISSNLKCKHIKNETKDIKSDRINSDGSMSSLLNTVSGLNNQVDQSMDKLNEEIIRLTDNIDSQAPELMKLNYDKANEVNSVIMDEISNMEFKRSKKSRKKEKKSLDLNRNNLVCVDTEDKKISKVNADDIVERLLKQQASHLLLS